MLRDLKFVTSYRTGEDDLVRSFYSPCLANSSSYWRASGYFRSSVYLLVHDPMLEFSRRGGKTLLVCSPELTPEDVGAIEMGYKERAQVVEARISDAIDRLLETEETHSRLRVLSTLVSHNLLDIKLAFRPNSSGIYHEKMGVFTDDRGDTVSFIGSVNETWSGWNYSGNHESMEVFCSWQSGSETQRVRNHVLYFDRLWNGAVRDLEVIDFPEAQGRRLIEYSHNSLENLTQATQFRPTKPTQESTDGDAQGDQEITPTRPSLYAHQTLAVENWIKAGHRGILQHATGSGKTITALTAMEHHLSSGNPALVLVPSKLLLEQWLKQARSYFPHAVILPCGAGHSTWKREGLLRSMTRAALKDQERVVVATIQTASSSAFRSTLIEGNHLLLVADEVHQMGSREASTLLTIEAGKRLGLSATPQRYGDVEGTMRVMEYFSGVVPPCFTLADAIREGRLVQYEYFPVPVTLSDTEASLWRELSRKISRAYAVTGGDKAQPHSAYLDLLIIERSRIAKKAAAKTHAVLKILQQNFKTSDRWLIYCEDKEQLNSISSLLRENEIHPMEFYSDMQGDPHSVLTVFEEFGGVLLSIRCLDEGVDIPAIDRAIIVASSQNPRQFIQRRGRVLRLSPKTDKRLAKIFDVLVIPTSDGSLTDGASLIESELSRGLEFAKSAINGGASGELRMIALNAGIDVDRLLSIGTEEECLDE